MASNPVRITVGEIQRGATAWLEKNQKDVITYLAIFIPATAVASFLDTSLGFITADPSQTFQRQAGLFGLIVGIASVIFQYRLFAAMLGKAPDSGKYLAFIGLAILTFVGTGLATVLLIIPGLIVGARWLMSPAIFTNEPLGVIDSMKASWARTDGNTQPVIFAVLLLFLVVIVVSIILSAVTGFLAAVPLIPQLVDAAVSEAASVALIGMSMAVYSLLGGQKEDLQQTFA